MLLAAAAATDAGADPPGPPEAPGGSATDPTTRPDSPAPDGPADGPFAWPLLPAFGEEGLIDWLDFDIIREKPRTRAGLRSILYDHRGVSGQSAQVGMTRYDVGVRNYGSSAAFGPHARIRLLDLDTHAVLPDTGERLPQQLWDVQAGMTFLWLLPPGLFDITLGSASDRPFAGDDELTADVTYLIGNPYEETGFLFIVNYSNNRDWLNRIIFPGFMFRFQPDDRLKVVAGFPFSGVRWRPDERWSFSATYSFPRTVRARAAYRPVRALELFAGFDWENQRYFRHDRAETKDRLWYVEKRVTGGVRWEIGRHAFVEAAAGYAFNRFFFEGETYEDREDNRVNVSDGAFAAVRVGVRF